MPPAILPFGAKQNRGFSLIEVLVTLVILAVGALGLAALQLTGMRSNYSAYQRTQVTIAVHDLVDRIHAEPERFRHRRLDTSAATGHVAFDAWRDELLRLGLTPPALDRHMGELDCTDANRCGAANCSVTVRWDDSRGQALAPAGTAGEPAPRGLSELAFRICTRLPR